MSDSEKLLRHFSESRLRFVIAGIVALTGWLKKLKLRLVCNDSLKRKRNNSPEPPQIRSRIRSCVLCVSGWCDEGMG